MKNSTLLFAFVFSLINLMPGSAQTYPEKLIISPNTETPEPKIPKGEIFWSEDFSDGLPNDWLNMNLNGFCAFSYTTKGPQGPLSIGIPALNSFTPQNGFMILDSDLCNAETSNSLLTDAFLQTPAISFSEWETSPNTLYFAHNFRYCCSSSQTHINVQVSTDSLEWHVFDVKNGVPSNSISSNAIYQTIDLSDILEGADQLWIRFHKAGASHYWWMIDDVMLMNAQPSEPVISKVQAERYYTKIPQGQQQDMGFAVDVTNDGNTTLENMALKTTVNQFLFESISDGQAELFPTQKATLSSPQDFLAPAKGVYDIEMILLSGDEENMIETSIEHLPLEITDTVYSRSLDVYDPDLFVESSDQAQFMVANKFKLLNEMQSTSVSLLLHENSQPGALLAVKLFYENEAGEYLEIYSTEEYSIAQEDITETGSEEISFLTMVFDQPVEMETGNYLVAVAAGNGEQTLALAAHNAPWYESGVSFFMQEQSWQPLDMIPAINLNFGANQADCNPSYHKVVANDICNSGTGFAEFIPLTGKGPFDYNWEDFEDHTLPLRENLSAGNYRVEITDGYGCLHIDSVLIENHQLELDYEVVDAVCDTDGEIIIHPLNGNEPFNFEWEQTEDTVNHLTGLSSGVYNVEVTDSAGCSANLEITLENDTSLPVDVIVQNAYCGENNGSVELIPHDGEEPYEYIWQNEQINDNMISNLAPGDYAYEVSDAGECVFSGNVTISDENYEIDIQVNKTDATCGLQNGEATAVALNGHEPYQYEWYHGYATQTIEGLATGNYKVQITDKHGCVGDKSVFIDQTGTMPEVTIDKTAPEICGDSTGSISLTPASEDDEFSYTLTELHNFTLNDQEEEDPDKDLNFQITGEGNYLADNLPSGQYLINVSDSTGTCNLKIQVDLNDGPAPEISAETANVSCYLENDGFINVELTDASENATLLWDDENASQTSSLSNLKPGVYNIKVTDNECQAFASYQITEPDLLHAQAQIEHITCPNTNPEGSIVLETMGGVPPYEYDWNNGVSENALIQITGGEYQVTVTDSNDCSFSDQFLVEEADSIVISGGVVEITSEEESDGVIVIEVSGGTGNYTYNWNNGAQTPVITGLALGEYSVTVTDENNCQESKSFVMTDVSSDGMHRKTAKVFPNPAKNNLFVEPGDGWNGQLTIMVYDIIGNKIKEVKTKDISGRFALDTSNFKPGIYLLQLKSGDVVWQHKFLKQ
ncbi:MAG: T9SS type A sorting domain-containing protein [Bacteroidales bacterium]